MTRLCAGCGDAFTPKRPASKYCGLPCLGRSRRRHPDVGKGDRSRRWTVCVRCGTSFRVRRSTLARGRGLLCRRCITVVAGRACRARHPLTAERNPNWKGGVTRDYAAWYRQWQKRYRQSHPREEAARMAVRSALRNGSLHRGRCADCGSTSDVQAHHHDYALPLDVTWLCRTCHNKRHGKLKDRTA